MISPDSVREVRQRLARTGPPRERSPGDYAKVALPPADADVLVNILDEDVRHVIEIGLGYASSALAIAESIATHEAADTRHVIIDPHQEAFDRVGIELLTNAGLDDHYELIEEESQLVLPRLVAAGEAFDAAFVDGSHKFHSLFIDLYFLQRLVQPGGTVVLDDCDWESVATAVDYYRQNMRWQRAPLTTRTRLVAFRLPDPAVDPPFDAFRPFGSGRPGFT